EGKMTKREKIRRKIRRKKIKIKKQGEKTRRKNLWKNYKNKFCPYCGKKITIKIGPGFSAKEEKKCETTGCEFNKPIWGSSSGWSN
ncbi:MAG: hypothetical protein U9M94_03175, partial [Patescibacteria group bacterium]|nr:hypothetical protein [Patescibacteria group bacterium]